MKKKNSRKAISNKSKLSGSSTEHCAREPGGVMQNRLQNVKVQFENPKLETWFLMQMRKAEAIIAKALDKVESLSPFDKQSIDKAVYHASVIDLELIQLINKNYDDFSESDVP